MSRSTFLSLLPAVVGAAMPFVILWRRHVALREPVVPAREPTADERAAVRRRGRWSVLAFVAFWLIAAVLILAVTLLPLTPLLGSAVVLCLVTAAVAAIAMHLTTRCPVCRYRLGYQRALGTPPRCERCGSRFV